MVSIRSNVTGLPASRAARMEAAPFGFHTNDLRRGEKGLQRHGDPRGQPPSADGHQDHLHLRPILGDLPPHRALAGDDERMIEGWNHDQAFVLGDGLGPDFPMEGGGAFEDDFGPQALWLPRPSRLVPWWA